MKDWEINQVNDLYKRMDALQHQNNQLKQNSECCAEDIKTMIKSMEDRLDRMGDRLDQVSGNIDDLLVSVSNITCDAPVSKSARKAK